MFDPRAVPMERSHGTGIETFTPPVPVWVDLAVAFPIRGRPERFSPSAYDAQARVPGRMHLMIGTATRARLAYVTCRMTGEGKHLDLAQWVILEAVERRHDAPNHRA